jgi:hypothetical protein
MSLILCFRGQRVFFFEAEFMICPYLARWYNLFDLQLIGCSIDVPWLVLMSLMSIKLVLHRLISPFCLEVFIARTARM